MELVNKNFYESTKLRLSPVIKQYASYIASDNKKYGYLQNIIKQHENTIEDAQKGVQLKFPAYQSVAIFLSNDRIPTEILRLMKERASKYAKKHDIVIENFRILKTEVDAHVGELKYFLFFCFWFYFFLFFISALSMANY